MALTRAKLIELIDNGDIDVGGGGVNPNILHNWDFRNPVNQRAVTGTISAAGYFFDRWILNSGSVTVAAGYLAMASGAVIEQRTEGLYLAGVTVTLSVKVGSNIHSGTGVFPTAAGTVDITLTGFGTATLGYNAGYMFVRFTASGSQNVVSVKCELGTVSTLHLDPPMDYGVELAKCQRYFRPLRRGTGRLFNASSTVIELAFDLTPPMYGIPTPSVPTLTEAVLCQNVALYTPTSWQLWPETTSYVVVLKFFGSYPTINNLISLYAPDVTLSSDL